jgi:hypothetical protein
MTPAGSQEEVRILSVPPLLCSTFRGDIISTKVDLGVVSNRDVCLKIIMWDIRIGKHVSHRLQQIRKSTNAAGYSYYISKGREIK